MPEMNPNSETAQKIPVNADTEETKAEVNENDVNAEDASDAIEPEIMTDEEIAEQDARNEQSEDSDTPRDEESSEEASSDKAGDDKPADDNKPAEEDKPAEVDWKDAYRRLAADFDNYRKRTSKEQDDVRKLERKRVIGAWLDVYDNAERALQNLPEKEGPWYEGFNSLIQQMDKCLATFNVKPVDDVGQKFDANRHEAIATIPNPAMENNTIMHVERRGFMYENGDILRHARVIVVKNPS
ncbi:MAG: nucleotide exchange factor GrpE [Proteobacteria bacterium]|nr:nucleotide exchange factor GrpE [Pseudomonadota bacterium]